MVVLFKRFEVNEINVPALLHIVCRHAAATVGAPPAHLRAVLIRVSPSGIGAQPRAQRFAGFGTETTRMHM
jgi:hypothetical protein